MYSVSYLSHTRLYNPNDPERKYSFVWEDNKEGVLMEVNNHPTLFSECTVWAPEEKYHDMVIYLDILRKVVILNPDVIIMPFTPKSGEFEDEMIKILKPYQGIIIAITAGPTEKAIKELPNLRGFVGPDESEMGQMAAEGIISTHRPKHVLIPNDKPNHAGYQERIKRIKEIASLYGVESVREVFFDVEDEKTFLVEPEENTVIIGLGPMGTKLALKVRQNYPDRIVGISTMDMSDETKDAIRANLLYSVIQHPREQGVKAVQIAADILEKKTSAPYIKKKCKLRIVSTLLVLVYLQNTFLEKTHCKSQCVSSFMRIIS